MEGGRGGLATGWRNLAVTRSQFKMICVLSQRWAHCTHFPQLQRCFFPGKTKHCYHQGVSDSAYVLSSREESQVLQFREKSSDNVFSPGETVHSQQQNLPGQPLQWAGKYLNIILFLFKREPKLQDRNSALESQFNFILILSGRGWSKAAGDAAEEDLPGDLHSASPIDNSCHLAQALAGWSVLQQWDGPESGGRLPPWMGSALLSLFLLLPLLPVQLDQRLLLLLKPRSPPPLLLLPPLPPCSLQSSPLAWLPQQFHHLHFFLPPSLLLWLYNEALQGSSPLRLSPWLTFVSYICHHILSKMNKEHHHNIYEDEEAHQTWLQEQTSEITMLYKTLWST